MSREVTFQSSWIYGAIMISRKYRVALFESPERGTAKARAVILAAKVRRHSFRGTDRDKRRVGKKSPPLE